MEIRINHVGKIIAGDGAGRYVRVEDDSINTGGYLVITSALSDMKDCFDDWVQNLNALRQYFKESCWTIEWL